MDKPQAILGIARRLYTITHYD